MPQLSTPLLFIASAGATAALSFGLCSLLMPLFSRYALARPNARSSHKLPTPQGGGVAVIGAALVVLTMLGVLEADHWLLGWQFVVLCSAALLLALVGAIDDIRPLPVLPRLACQALASASGLLAAGAFDPDLLFGLPALLILPLLLAGLVWFVNLTNFMDGIDGITLAGFLPLLGAIAVLSAAGAAPVALGLVAAALAGGLLGFAPFNRHVARLFLGDVGSLAIGFLAGWLLLALALDGHLACAIVLPLYYLCDTGLTLARRLKRGERVSQAHRTHFYQRATDLGWRVPAITRRVLAVNVVLAGVAALSVFADSPAADILAIGAGTAVVAWLLWALSRPPLAVGRRSGQGVSCDPTRKSA